MLRPTWDKGWRHFALAVLDFVERLPAAAATTLASSGIQPAKSVVPTPSVSQRNGAWASGPALLATAVSALANAISHAPGRNAQDVLRLLSVWFAYGMKDSVAAAVSTALAAITPDTWLQAVPQLIARLTVCVLTVTCSFFSNKLAAALNSWQILAYTPSLSTYC